jgi:gamma-butyrobetaine dioxygenase
VSAIVSEIFELFARFGSRRYGEDLCLQDHMGQTAAMAQSLGAPASLVVAALLHDIGYFLDCGPEMSASDGGEIGHEAVGAAWLSRAFDEEVTVPVALHVSAKRYLCAVEPRYHEQLSEASRRSLARQGGAMSQSEAAAFAKEPAFEAAVLLRRCDDQGKNAQTATPDIERYRDLVIAALRPID